MDIISKMIFFLGFRTGAYHKLLLSFGQVGKQEKEYFPQGVANYGQNRGHGPNPATAHS